MLFTQRNITWCFSSNEVLEMYLISGPVAFFWTHGEENSNQWAQEWQEDGMLMGCKVNHIVGLVGLHPHHLFELVITVCRNVLTSVETEPKLT